MDLPPDAVLRVNMAWIKTRQELESTLSATGPRKVFLDYPEGRHKPPKPVLTLDDAYESCQLHSNILYFAVSNVESVKRVLEIKSHLPNRVQFVPKIETFKGIKQFRHLVHKCGIKTVMLDKEDLYLDVNEDNDEFFNCVEHIRSICTRLKVNLLELEGVVFTHRK